MFQSNAIVFMMTCFALNTALGCVDPELTQRDYNAVGVVKNTDGEIVYEEHHRHKADIRGGVSQVDYKLPNGKLIAKKTIDYDCRASAPNYILTMNQAPQWVEQVRWQSNQLVVTQPQSKEVLDPLDNSPLVIDVGFDNFVFENWQELISGNEKEINFLYVPGNRLFHLVIKLETDNRDIEVSPDVALFRISTKSKLLRLFSNAIFLAYNKESRQLDFYSGPTNLRGDIAGLEKSKQIAIKYRYN